MTRLLRLSHFNPFGRHSSINQERERELTSGGGRCCRTALHFHILILCIHLFLKEEEKWKRLLASSFIFFYAFLKTIETRGAFQFLTRVRRTRMLRYEAFSFASLHDGILLIWT